MIQTVDSLSGEMVGGGGVLIPLEVCVGGELMRLKESVAASWAGHADAAGRSYNDRRT